jgi:internalin A
MKQNEETIFMNRYAHCGSEVTLWLILGAIENQSDELNLSGKLLLDLSPLLNLTNLRELNISNTQISNLEQLKHLDKLESLNVSSTQIIDLNSLESLNQLEDLDVSETQVMDLSPLINLTALQQLSVSNTQVSNLTPLANLQALQELSVSNTQVSDLRPLTNLIALQQLYVENTQVSDLTPLTNLQALKHLSVNKTQVSDLTPLTNLTALQYLDVNNTQVSDLTPLTHLTALEYLYVSNTQVSDLTPLTHLTALEYLYVNYTQVSDLTPLSNLSQLNYIDIDDTAISDLLPLRKAIQNNSDFTLSFRDCPLTNPPVEIAKQGNAAILRYWQEQERVGLKKVNEARLLLVGQGASGKTTLKEKLKDSKAAMPAPDDTTRGINIEPIKCLNTEGDDFTVQVWDFGGQNIQKYAHQFFMSDSVVYAVLSNTREQNPNFQYWLNIIELLGKESPFFIVQNEKDGHIEPLKDITQIQERFPQTFKSVENVNLKNADTDPRFEILKQRLFYEATQLPHTQKEYLVSFINVREQLTTLSKTQQTIPFRQFKALCKAEGIEDVELMNDYAKTFTLLGIALHFADDVHLKTHVFLRPKWIIDALFAVLYANIVDTQHGTFSESDAATIWHNEDYDDMHGVLLQLMVKFHLCYAIPNSKSYIVPQRLPTRSLIEAFVPPPDATHIIYKYRFLPSGILTQLTCRLHTRIEGDKVWNDAVQFSIKDREARVFVRENNTDNQLELFGFGQHKADLINTVVDMMDEIHDNSKYGNLKVEKLVPCPCTTCADNRAKQKDAHFFKYDLLIQDLRNGETDSDRCELSRKRFPIKDILKNASIRLYKLETIRDLLTVDKVKEALDILRGVFPEEDEVILQLSNLSHSNRQHRQGQITDAVHKVERTRLIKDILAMLRERESDV